MGAIGCDFETSWAALLIVFVLDFTLYAQPSEACELSRLGGASS